MSERSDTLPGFANRRLAAVMFTDVVGYSSRVQADETGTLEQVQLDFERMRGICAAHAGEIRNSMGDGLLVTFDSALQAVTCGLAIQGALANRGPGALAHRIGIHLGDIFQQEGQVLGDGVNIAARLESCSRPGTICLSQTVWDTVRDKMDLEAEFLGTRQLKGIGHPVPAWLVAPANQGISPGGRPRRRRPAALLGAAALVVAVGAGLVIGFAPRDSERTTSADPEDGLSLAVLPFEDRTAETEDHYLVTGIQEGLINRLARIHSLRVTSRTSTLQFPPGQRPANAEIADSLNVALLLDGSAQKVGDRVLVRAQLIDSRSDQTLWGDDFDREVSDILNLQTEVTRSIAEQIEIELTGEEQRYLNAASSVNPGAYEAVIKANEMRDQMTAASLAQAEQLYNTALTMAPDYGVAEAGLASVWIFRQQLGLANPDEAGPAAVAAATRALALDPGLAEAHGALARVAAFSHWDWQAAESAYQRALSLNPSLAVASTEYAIMLDALGREEESRQQIAAARRVDPLNPFVAVTDASLMINRREPEQALEILDELNRHLPQNTAVTSARWSAHALRGDATAATDNALAFFQSLNLSIEPGPVQSALLESGYQAAMMELADQLDRTENTAIVSPLARARVHVHAGQTMAAIRDLESAYTMRDANLPGIGNTRDFDSLREIPAFRDLLRRLNLRTDQAD